MEFLQANNLPVLFHAGYEPRSQPAHFVPLAEAFPRVRLILGHMAYRMAGDAIIVAQRIPNIYLETSGNWDDLIKAAIRTLGSDRVLFGSNLPFQIPEVEIMKVSLLDIPQEDKDLVLGGNAIKLHSLQPESASETGARAH
jgi:predicted TIM-barrel fold metal-dependent hydrolase